MPDQVPPAPQSVTMVDPGTGRAADVPLDQINAYQDQGFTLETPDERAGRLSAEARASIYGGAKGALLAGTAGVLRGATLGGSDVAARALEGEDAAIALQGYREAHPGISFASELGGAVLPSLVSGGAAAPAGLASAAGRGTAAAVGGGLRGALAGGAVEGALFGAGQGVSELALSRDPLTLEHAAAAIGSNALYGAGVGALAGGAFKGVEIGLGKARAVVQDFADRQAAAQDLLHAGAVVGEDLAGLDTKGLRAARDTELDRIAQEQATQRTAARSSAVDDLLAYRRTVKDANPWLVITEGEPSKQLSKANNAIRAALDDPNGLRESPGSLLKPLRIEEQALQNAVENRATIAAKLDEVNAKIAADLEKQLPVAAPAAPPVEPPAAARGRIEVNDIGGQRMRATMPDGSTVDLGTSGADAFLEQQMPPGFHPAKIETYRPFAIEHGLPATAADVARLEDNAIYIARPSELIKRDLWGNELKEANRDSILSAWKEGKTLKPIDGWVTPEGRLYIEDGNHRLQAAALDGDRPVAIRFRDGTNYDPQRGAREIGDRIRADLGAALPKGTPTAGKPPSAAGAPTGPLKIRAVGPRSRPTFEATLPDGSTQKLADRDEVERLVNAELPPGFNKGPWLETHRDLAVTRGLPGDHASILDNALYIARPSELADHGIFGNDIHPEHATSMAEARATGVKLEPIEIKVTPDGKYWLEDGNHRLNEAAKTNAPVAIKFRTVPETFERQRNTYDISERIRSALPKGATESPAAAGSAPAARPATWREFQAAKMGEYMRSEGGHAGAMKRLAKEWQEIKAGSAQAPTAPAPAAPPAPESIALTGRAARRYASYADIKVPKGGSVTLAREDAQGFLDALKSGQVQGESRAALDRLGELLEQNRALQARIKEAAAPLKPRNELASERLTAIENAQEVLRQPKPRTEPPPGTKLLSHVAYGASAGLVGLIPGVGHVLGPVVGSKVADAVAGAMGKLSSAAAESQRRLARIAAGFLGKAAPVAGKAAELAPPVATKVLAALRYGEPETDERGRRVAKPEPKTLPELYKARTDEIKTQVQLAPDGTYQMRPAARARMAARLSGLGVADPIAADRLESAGAARIAWLASQMPRRPDLAGLPVGPDTYQPSDAAMRGWARKAAAAEDPYGVLERASAGAKARVVPEEIMALRALHSALLDDYITQIIAGLSEREQRLPYAQRLSLSMLTGRPLDPAMTPAVLRELQSMFASEPGTAGGTMAPRPNPQFGSVKRSDPGTPAQRRQGIGL